MEGRRKCGADGGEPGGGRLAGKEEVGEGVQLEGRQRDLGEKAGKGVGRYSLTVTGE